MNQRTGLVAALPPFAVQRRTVVFLMNYRSDRRECCGEPVLWQRSAPLRIGLVIVCILLSKQSNITRDYTVLTANLGDGIKVGSGSV